jgi:hypothetical protein
MPTLQQIPGTITPYYQPYIDAGSGALSQLSGQLGNLVGDTGGVYNRLAEGYKESPGFKRSLEQALMAGTAAQAAGGMAGSPLHQQQNMGIASDIASKDFQNYLQNQMGLYGMGIQGLGGLSNLGYGAASGLADNLGSGLSQQAAMNYADQLYRNQQKSSGLGGIFSGIGSLLGGLF